MTIVPNSFCIAGYKQHGRAGYHVSVVKYEPAKIEEAMEAFKAAFAQAAEKYDKDGTIAFVKRLAEQASVGTD